MPQPSHSFALRGHSRWFAAVLTVLAVVGASAAYGSSGTVIGHKTRLSAHKALPVAQPVTPLASSPTAVGPDGKPYALYARYNLTPTAGQLDRVGTLLAVEADGATRDVGSVTPDMSGFSMAGAVLTAASKSDPGRVYWWEPSTATAPPGYNEASVPADDRYLTSAPDGWYVVDSDGNIIDEPATSGSPAIVAKPFPGVDSIRIAAVSGPTGLVLSDQSALAFVAYGTRTVTPLDTSAAKVSPDDGVYPMCWSVSATDAACGSYDSGQTTGNPSIANVFVDPLDGSTAVAVSSASCPHAPTITGATAAWRGCDDRLATLDATTVTTSAHPHPADPIAGLNGFLSDDKTGTKGLLFSPDQQSSEVVLASDSARVEAAQFALTTGRIVWQQDDAGPTPAALSVQRRSVDINASTSSIDTGPTVDVGRSHLAGAPLAAAGHIVAYAKKSTGNDNAAAANVRVVTPSTSVVLHNVDRDRELTIGDHRVVYDNATSERAHLFNIRTGLDTPLDSDTAVISSHYLAYVEDDEILQKDLTTGHIATVDYDADVMDNGLFEHGDVVGWNATCYPDNGVTIRGAYRDMTNDTTPTLLPDGEGIWALSDAGVITVGIVSPDNGAPSYVPSLTTLSTTQTATFALRPYGSNGEQPILSGSYLDEGPQLHAGVLAWIDAKGKLEAEPLL